jgi:LemA protein
MGEYDMAAVIIFLGVVLVVGLVLIGIYNRLVGLRQNCNQGFSDIDVQLKQRHDLIPNLIETVKAYAAHEKETLNAVIEARQKAVSAQGTPGQGAAESALGGALGRVFALAESYPDLKANQNFLQFQNELSDIEDKISATRRAFNAAVSDYNAATETFPAVLFAKSFGFLPRTFFDLGETRVALEAAPAVKF